MSLIHKHFKAISQVERCHQIAGIDAIYVINLDQRVEKYERCLKQFLPYGITPQRFSAIYGWDLSQEAFDEIGLKFLPPMDFLFDRRVFFRPSRHGDPGEPLNESSYGRTCVNIFTIAGAIGCALSHLSCLQHGLDSGYQTIWILEDDAQVNHNPHFLTHFLQKLDQEVGEDGWDILYTDNHHIFPAREGKYFHFRPDRPLFYHSFDNFEVGQDFIQINGRAELHSTIYRRSGIKKAIDYFTQFGLFHPIDIELYSIPHMRMYNLKHDLVGHSGSLLSDTRERGL